MPLAAMAADPVSYRPGGQLDIVPANLQEEQVLRPSYRVAHYGTGDTGVTALRAILARPELELVAHLVHSPEKVGRDSGEIAGGSPCGVSTTADRDEFLSVDADCVAYFATDFGRAPEAVVDEMCAMLASGRNIVTSTMPVLVYPNALPRDVVGQLQDACARGRSSLFCTGIAPGFTPDALVLTCASLCDHVSTITVSERVFMGTYGDPLSFAYMGFGRTPEEDATNLRTGGSTAPFHSTFALLGAGLGIEFEDVREARDVALADADYECAVGPIPEGTIASVRLSFEGLVGGEPRVAIRIVYSVIDTVVDDWDPPVRADAAPDARSTRVQITGSPDLECDLVLSGSDQPGVDATAARVVNSIGATCRADPGLLTPLDLAVFGDQTFRA